MVALFLFFQVLSSQGNFNFYIFPWASYKGNEIFTLEIWYEVDVKNILLIKKGGMEEGSFDIEVKWRKLPNERWNKETWTKKFKIRGHTEETKIYDLFSINLQEGEYEIEVNFKTRVRMGTVSFKKKLEARYPFISDIFISPSIGKKKEYFFKRESVGFDIKLPFQFVYPDTIFYYYYELYGFEGNEEILYEILRDNNVIYTQKEKAPSIQSGFTYGRIPIYKFGEGNFVFRINILKDDKVVFSRDINVVYVSQRQLQEKNIREFYEKYLFFIDYFASPQELSEFRKLKTFESKKIFVQKFWKKFDPDPETEANEFIYELIERIRFADNNFSLGLKRLGRYTDRGRIFIKYGKPAEVENSYYPHAERAWESWIYNKPRRMQFVFSDINQDGNYILVYSSIPEEIPSRADWRRWVPEEAIQVRQ